VALLKGKTAVITGGSGGVGLAVAKRFAEEGAYVFINGRSQAELDAAVKEIGGNVTGVPGDGSRQGDRDRLYAAVADAGRRLDVVFANAAAIDVARIGEVTLVHLQKALPLLNDGGSIILNSADPDSKVDDGAGAYAAIMVALRSLATTWGSELQDRKIRVGVIGPDATETPGINALAGMVHPSRDTAGEFANYQRIIVPPARNATAQKIADTALSLAAGLTGLATGVSLEPSGRSILESTNQSLISNGPWRLSTRPVARRFWRTCPGAG
jgi:NAD(P)-dependent dehydrogenase (short-subunit alcohol dehydrogenase family)